ncbi:hypothetical protein LCGC14_2629330, partial [marine sediment metagenome]
MTMGDILKFVTIIQETKMFNSKKRWVVRRFVGVSAYLSVILLVSGCADRYDRVMAPTKKHTEISKTHSNFSTLANRSNLPFVYVNEGKIGISKVEAALEAA